MIGWIVLIGAIILLCFVIARKKRLICGNLTLVTGGVKMGKTHFAVYKSLTRYAAHMFEWRVKCFFCLLTGKKKPEKPLFYSNVPVGFKGFEYVPITPEVVLRTKRMAYKSVVYFNEITFLAGSMDFRDEDVNDALLYFFKLIAHETKGGYCYIDTQSPQDMHFAIKRSLSTYITIYKKLRLPIFTIVWVRENLLVDGEHTVAVDTQVDPQDSTVEGGKPMYWLLLPNRYWKAYDRYAYSHMTDHLEVETSTVKITNDPLSHKQKNIVRLKKIIKKRGEK